ncbi:MAG: hypothetical protein HY755_08110 [Nitrospirae bacterium]|nr:hypothetical protein [Nitrospirota bacterium]
MKKAFFTAIALSVIFAFSISFSADKESFQIKKQPEIQQVKPKKPVKIKLKRSAEGRYTWELSGDDADEIARVDKKLRKLLKVE